MRNEFKYVADIDNETFEKENVLPFIDEAGKPCILIRNSREKTNMTEGSTDSLGYHLNSVFYKNDKPFYFHMISCLKNDERSREQFRIAYEYLFKSLQNPISDYEIGSLIASLGQLFKVSPEKDLSDLQIGVFGELLFILYAHEKGASAVLSKYHSDFFSKHDLEFDKNNRIEVKSTTGPKRIHRFSHDQLVRNDINVYVVSVLLEESSEGVSLNGLFDSVLKLANDPKTILCLGRLKGLCGVSNGKPGPSFALQKAKDDLRIYKASDLPHIEDANINGITNISYDVDCSFGRNIEIETFVKIIIQLIG